MESNTKNKQTKKDILNMVRKAFGDNSEADSAAVTELTEGFYNAAYLITLPEKEVILKIAPPVNSKIMSYENNIMKAEVNALRLIKEKTSVPVPGVLFYDDTHDICRSDYFFMDKVEGDSFYKLKCNGMPEEKQKLILQEIGRYNALMNQIEGIRFGYVGQKEKQGHVWKDTFLSMVSDVLSDGEKIEINLGLDYDYVRKQMEKASFALDEVKQPNFVHWDLWDGNVFVKDDKITGIIDFERALWGDPLMEYFFRSHSFCDDFNKGYGAELRKEAPIRALLYDIYLYLIMVIETKYRNYPDDGQYHFAVNELQNAMEQLNHLL